jgi:hypothetical protein
MHGEASSALRTAEVVHWITLCVMGIVYTLRVLWLLRFKAGKDRSPPGGEGRTSAKRGAYYSLANVAMPWSMESTRRGLFFYLTFVVFHLGITCGIALAFISTLYRPFVAQPVVAWTFGTLIGLAFLIGIGRMIRRLIVPVMRLISTPDDYGRLGHRLSVPDQLLPALRAILEDLALSLLPVHSVVHRQGARPPRQLSGLERVRRTT